MTRRMLVVATVVIVLAALGLSATVFAVVGFAWWVSGVAVLLGVVAGAAIAACRIAHRDHLDRVRARAQFDAAVATLPRPSTTA